MNKVGANNEFEMVKTGNGYAADLAATTNKRLEQTITELRLHSSQLVTLNFAQDDTTEATNNLEKTIKELDKQNKKLNSRIFWLTIITTVLALIQIIPILIKLSLWK